MFRYLLRIAYSGEGFCGWQRQPDAITVQGLIEEALSRVTRQAITIVGSGRTDTGVHAENQVAHFSSVMALDEADLLHRLNRMLPDSVLIKELRAVPENFHARFSAEWRQYRYQMLTEPNPFMYKTAWYSGKSLNMDRFKECLGLITGEHDFSGFSRPDAQLSHSRCKLLHAELHLSDDSLIVVRLRSNRFLRSMVRALIASMVETASGKKSTGWFKNQLQAGSKLTNIALAPSGALFLEDVFYPKSVFQLD